MDKLIFILMSAGAAVCAAIIICISLFDRHIKFKYGRISCKVFFEKYIEIVYGFVSKFPLLEKINNEAAYKISVLNTLSIDKNKRISAAAMTLCAAASVLLSIVVIICFMPYWYIALVYIMCVITALLFALQLLSDFIMNIYIRQMPEALKILQSRFMSKKSISKAIHVSIPDMPKGIRSEMIRIYNALKLNETEKTKEVFREIDIKYSNEHMSLLLDLIWIAHYTGGSESVKKQFDTMLQDVIEDMENRKDLKSAAMSYILLSAAFIFAVPAVRIYNSSLLNAEQMLYYKTKGGMLLAAGCIGFLILTIALLIHMIKKI